MAASSSVVIKVKYGDTLRRFNAQFAGNHELNLTMDGLRNKIISFFSFNPDTEFTLTYIDEDDDVVTLVDDDDLRDAVKQALDPLRITVTVDAEKKGPQVRMVASSSPLTPPRELTDNGVPEIPKSLPGPLYETLVELYVDLASKASSSEHLKKSLQNLNTGLSQMVGTVPEPLRESIDKLTADLASKAKLTADRLTKKSYSAPGTSELADHFRKMGMPFIDQLSQPHVGVDSFSTENGISGKTKGLPKSKPTTENNEVKIQSASGSTILKSSQNSEVDGKPKKWSPQLLKKALNKVDGKDYLTSQTDPVENNAGKDVRSSFLSSNVPFIVNKSGGEPKMVPSHASVGASGPTNALPFDDVMSGGFGKNAGPFWVPPSPGNFNYPGLYDDYSTAYECPFSGLVTETGSAASPLPASRMVGSFKRSVSQNEYNANIFHRGVRCDGCGVHPITGPRFKSNVKVNYDLCSICFDEMGNGTDYIRIDRPALYRHNMSLKALNEARARGPTFHQVHKSFKVKPVAAKLDSRFIKDVNIFDGTVMAPVTPFTKIWRMRNNGTAAWPEKTQLVWIGGDKLSNELVVEVQIPAAGLKINQEVEVAVNFLSPELPGRYTSYWRMSLPSGQKFGQRIWVLIQVDSSLKDAPPCENGRNLNLNLPPSSMIGSEIINVDLQPIVEDGPAKPLKREELAVQQPNTDQDLKFPINDSLLVGNGASSSRPVSYPIIDFTDVVLPAVQSVGPTVTYPAQEQIPRASMDVEEKLLKELEEMGFKEVDLNKQMLRMNEYDLGQAVDDLCGVAEWDPILDELQEMGFHDTATNKMLLKKNNGSIKRVVMDLIAGEKIE